MRYSADQNDPGYENWARDPVRWRKTDILLDGAVVKRVITVDEDEGYILRNATDEDGEHLLNGDEFVREELRGVVTFRHRA